MKNQKGFIQIPLLIAIIAGVFILGGGGYLGVKQYQDYQTEKTEQEKIAIEKEAEAQAITEAQQKALEQAQVEIEKLKQESETAKQKQTALEKTVSSEKQSVSYTISASDLGPYLTGVVEIICPVDPTALVSATDLNTSRGSGTLWQTNSVLTNDHVIEDAISSCGVIAYDESGYAEGKIAISPSGASSWNSSTDVAFMRGTDYGKPLEKNVSQLNYKISLLRKCSIKMPVGSPVAIVGFPSSGTIKVPDGVTTSRIVTNGIVSGYDISQGEPFGNLPYSNYFVSAKIDSGNSGGMAFSKDQSGLCTLGIPTWLTIGSYETQGLIQNIHNVMYKN